MSIFSNPLHQPPAARAPHQPGPAATGPTGARGSMERSLGSLGSGGPIPGPSNVRDQRQLAGDPNAGNNNANPPTEVEKQKLRDKAKYDTRLRRAEAVKAKLIAMPEAKSQLDVLNGAMLTADGHFQRKDYTKALKVLEGVDFASLEKKAELSRKNTNTYLLATVPDVVDQSAKLRAEASSEPLFSDAERRRWVDEVDVVTSTLRAKAVDHTSIVLPTRTFREQWAVKFEGRLRILKDEIETRKQRCDLARLRIGEELKLVQSDLQNVLSANPAEMGFEDKHIYKTVQTESAAREYEAAHQAVLEFRQKVEAMLPGISTNRKKWEALQPGLTSLILEARSHETTTETDVLRVSAPYAGETAQRLRVLKGRWDARDIPYAEAIAEFTACRGNVQQNRARLSKLVEVAAERERAQFDIAQALASARGKVTRLCTAIADVDARFKPEVSEAPLTKQLDGIEADWDRRLTEKIDAAALETQTFEDRIVAVGNEADRIAGDRVELTTEFFNLKRAQILAETKKWEVGIDQLAGVNLENAKLQAGFLNRTKDTILRAETLAQLLEEEARLKAAVVGFKGMADANRIPKEDVSFEAVEKALTALTSDIAKRKEEADYGELRDECASDLKTLQLDATIVPNNAVEKAALSARIAELKKKIDKISAAVAGSKDSSGKRAATVAGVRNSIARGRTRLNDGALKDYLGVKRAELSSELDAIEKRVGHELPGETAVGMEAWNTRYTQAKTDARVAKQEQAKFDEEITKALAKVKEIPGVPEWAAQIAKKLDVLKKNYRDESKRADCKDGLERLKGELTEAEATPAIALEKNNTAKTAEDQAKTDTRKAQLDQAEWEGLATEFENRIKIAPSLGAGGKINRFMGVRNPASTPREELQQLLANAKAKFATDGDLEAAKTRLNAAQRRADFYEKYPDGGLGANRAALPQVLAAWKSSLAGLTGSMDELVRELNKLPDADLPQDPGKKTVADEIAKLKSLFRLGVFDRPVTVLTAGEPGSELMRANREEALRSAGTMLAYLQSDPRIRALATNPFVSSLPQAIAAARSSLINLERTLLNSI